LIIRGAIAKDLLVGSGRVESAQRNIIQKKLNAGYLAFKRKCPIYACNEGNLRKWLLGKLLGSG